MSFDTPVALRAALGQAVGHDRDSGTSTPDEAALLRFLRVIASPDQIEVARMLALTPVLAVATVRGGATREDPSTYRFEEIRHYVYVGDTGLHVAAAAHRPAAALSLIASGAEVRARTPDDASAPSTRGTGDVQ